MRKPHHVRSIAGTDLGRVRGGDGGTGAPPPQPPVSKQHVDNPGQTPMQP